VMPWGFAQYFFLYVHLFEIPLPHCPWSTFSVVSVQPSVLYKRVPYTVTLLHGWTSLCKRWLTSGIHHCPGSVSSADHSTLQ
jgi:hypothetical protein